MEYAFNIIKENYLYNKVYPHNYAMLSTQLSRDNLELDNDMYNYCYNYWFKLHKIRKKYWLNFFRKQKLFKKI